MTTSLKHFPFGIARFSFRHFIIAQVIFSHNSQKISGKVLIIFLKRIDNQYTFCIMVTVFSITKLKVYYIFIYKNSEISVYF